MYEYTATIVSVVDGDTVDLIVDLGFRIQQTIRCRLMGVNTPELTSKIDAERARALEAKQYVITHASNRPLRVKTYKDKTEKYGRYLVDIFYEEAGVEHHLNQDLITTGLAVSYYG